MKLKTAINLRLFLAGLDIVLCILYVITRNDVFGYLAGGVVMALLLVFFLFTRCPHCGKFLGLKNTDKCPKCHKKLNA